MEWIGLVEGEGRDGIQDGSRFPAGADGVVIINK